MNTFIHEIDRDIRHFETIITPYRVQLKTFEAYLDDIAFASYQYEVAARYRDYLEMKYNHIFVRRLSLRYAQEVVKDIYEKRQKAVCHPYVQGSVMICVIENKWVECYSHVFYAKI